ncbi:MAG: septum formation protein Maf [Clostridia bacterium]|nr:septum formation protein Maf [Clostridia bacterium]
MQYVLASASPRRKELLKEVVDDFEIIPSAFDESSVTEKDPKKLVKKLAEGKAKDVALQEENEGKIVLGSDTVVAYKNEVLGKPKDEANAVRMLTMLSGKKHYVYTGVCFATVKDGKTETVSTVVGTAVYFNELSQEWIRSYVAGGSPMDKAGAYGIQDGGLVKKIKGSYSNVVGLPVEKLQKTLKKMQKKGFGL